MSQIVESIKAKAKTLNKTVVLPEGEDARVVRAAAVAASEGLANVVLIGNEAQIKAQNPDVDLTAVTVIDPATSEKTATYANMLYELRKAKGMTEEQAAALALDPTHFAVLMLKAGDCDGLVSGACHSTADTLRPGLQIVKTAPGVKLVSSCFVMIAPEDCEYCPEGAFVYGDCGLNMHPNAEELAYIAISSADSAKNILGIEPRVAMLSFSTKGSAKHDDVNKVTEATAFVKEFAPELSVDGELQFDAALVPSVGASKAKGSTVAGKANVFIFPDLDAGNIGYKITERLGRFQAIGPLCQGFAKPINDLSRGCKWEDIVVVIAITALQAAN